VAAAKYLTRNSSREGVKESHMWQYQLTKPNPGDRQKQVDHCGSSRGQLA